MSVNPVVGEEKINELVSEFWPVKPEPGSVADQLIKKGEVKGRQEGRQEGKLAGRVQICQELLGDEVTSDEELMSKSTEELTLLISVLQERLRKRSK